MENKKWYWDNLYLLHTNQNTNHNEIIIVMRKNYIKLIHSKLYTEAETSSSIRIFAPGSAYTLKIMNNNGDYDMEVCGNIEILTNIIKELIRDIKIKQLGI
jgi:hypothetical protein